MLKYFASIPVILSVIAGAYGTLNYVNKLTTQIDNSSDTIALLEVEVKNLEQRLYGDINNMNTIFTDKTGRNSQAYTEAREELVKEMAEFSAWVGRIEGVVNALRDASYKMAADSELRALEELVRNNSDSIRQYKYDLEEVERKATGGY
jgi:FtsZ-binding cell division protein ZapB